MRKIFFAFVLLLYTFYTSASPHVKIYSTTTCEGHTLKLICSSGRTINVIAADYGRWNATVCPYYDDPNMNLRCHSQYANAVIKTICDGHHTCKIKVNNDNLMDPCPGQIKYAEAKYLCLDKK
ncbi:Calcium-independent receptor for alpha-latrotoxin [Carabus blaptoides fortunei]